MLQRQNSPENVDRNGGIAKMSMLEQLQQLGCGIFNTNDQLNLFSTPVEAHDQYFHGLIGFNNFRSFPPSAAPAIAEVATAAHIERETALPQKLSSSEGRENFKKRKADKIKTHKAVTEESNKNKRFKGCREKEDSKVTDQKSTSKNNTDTPKEPFETSKQNSDVQKPDYIHVRAHRGKATDSHSLAERIRREKISQRMKYLQDLVPGCNKITGKAGMLDEIINYVQFLQRQVEFLSMKLAAVNPMLDFNVDNNFTTEQVVSCCGLETRIESPDMALQRTIIAPESISETLIESLYSSKEIKIQQIQPSSTWDDELQSLYPLEFQQGETTLSLSQPCTGYLGGSTTMMEM